MVPLSLSNVTVTISPFTPANSFESVGSASLNFFVKSGVSLSAITIVCCLIVNTGDPPTNPKPAG